MRRLSVVPGILMKPWLAGLLCAAAVALPARGGDEVPRLPCGAEPFPAFGAVGAQPNVRAWSGAAAREWQPPACIGWSPKNSDMLVGVAGSFRHDGDIDALLARIGAISSKKGVRYWSTTEKEWKPLVTEAFALTSADPAQPRADFAAPDFIKGKNLHYAQSDNRSTGKTVYRERVLALDRERVVLVSENVTPLKMAIVTLFDPGDIQAAYVIERRGQGVWSFYSVTRTRMASTLLPTGGEASYINRAVAFYRLVAGVPTDQEPPAAR